MKTGLHRRLEQLEAKSLPRPQQLMQYGWVTPLPSDFVGERHTVILQRRRIGPNLEWCRFQERPGPAPRNV